MFKILLVFTFLILIACTFYTLHTKKLITYPTTAMQWGTALFLFIFTASLYFILGGWEELLQHQYMQQVEDSLAVFYQQHPDVIISKMEQAASEHPDDPEVWYLLAKLYAANGDASAANHALQKSKNLLKQ